MSVRILTSRQVKGPQWAARYPEKSADLWVVAIVAGKRRRVRIGPPTEANRIEAERRSQAWSAIAHGADLSTTPAFGEAGDAFLTSGLYGRARSTEIKRNQQVQVLQGHWGDRQLDQITTTEIVAWADGRMGGSPLAGIVARSSPT